MSPAKQQERGPDRHDHRRHRAPSANFHGSLPRVIFDPASAIILDMGRRLREARRGVALATALLLMLFLLVVGVAMLSLLEQDVRHAGREAETSQAYYLALSGAEYQRAHPSDPGPGQRKTLDLGQSVRAKRLDISVAADGTVTSRGYLLDSDGKVVCERTVVMPAGDRMRMYER